MASIEVTYKQTSCHFTISTTTSWSTLESQLHSLFNIPASTPIFLSYTDEDGDVITLSSDLELLEVISAREYDNEKLDSDAFLKFTLTLPSDERDSREEDNNSWIFEGGAAHIKEERIGLINDDSNDDDSDREDNAPHDDDSSEDESTAHKFVMAEEPVFEPTVSTSFVTDRILQDEEKKQGRSSTSQHESSGETCSPANSSQNQHRCTTCSAFQETTKIILSVLLFITLVRLLYISFYPLITLFLLSKGLKLVKGQHHRRWFLEFCGCGHRGNESNSDIDSVVGSVFECFRRHQRCGMCCGSRKSEIELKEKLEILRSMGFDENDDELVKLIEIHYGNIDRIVDMLLERK